MSIVHNIIKLLMQLARIKGVTSITCVDNFLDGLLSD